MKAKELIELLTDVDPDAEVILQKDSEGNGFSPLAGADGDAVYIAENTWSGNVYPTDWNADGACMDEDEWAELMAKPRCVVLFPIN